MNIPSREECLEILHKNGTPSNIIEHCKAVCKLAEEIADKLIKKRIKVNKELVIAGALLHDIERDKEDHIAKGAKLLKKLGFPEVAEVIKKHSLYQIEKEEMQPQTIEQKIAFYSDKRVRGNKIVSVKERFDYLRKRYEGDLKKEFEFVKKVEEELSQ